MMLNSIVSRFKENPLRAGLLFLQPGRLLSLWVALRLPLLAAIIYFIWPDEFIWLITLLAIHLLGTLPDRLALFILILAGLGGGFLATEKLCSTSGRRYLARLGVGFGLFWILFYFLPASTPLVSALFLTTVLALNTVSASWLLNFMTQRPGRWIAPGIWAGVIGLSEILLVKPLLLWLPQPWFGGEVVASQANRRLIYWLPVVWVAGLGALLPSADSLADLHRSLFPDPAVQQFAKGNFNWLELDSERRVLYAAGFGTNYLQAYHTDALDKPPRLSPVANGYAQGFAYNPKTQELYVYNHSSQQLLFLDSVTLELKKSIPVPQVSPGDTWVLWAESSDSIVIASEADELEGFPFVVVDRITGRILAKSSSAPGYIIPHPVNRSLLFMSVSFFQDSDDLLVYDTRFHKIVNRLSLAERIDRMAFARYGNDWELLAPSPADSKILRFDPATLESKGSIKTLFGARAIAVDSRRNLLLCGSLVTHKLEIIDLTTHQQIAEYYLGPWLRTITLDVKAGLAYVSAHDGLFAVRYAN